MIDLLVPAIKKTQTVYNISLLLDIIENEIRETKLDLASPQIEHNDSNKEQSFVNKTSGDNGNHNKLKY